jgi:hypothetical protein
MSTALVQYDAMCSAIDAAYQVDEVKDIRDKAVALEAYARQAKNVEAERRACEIRLRAERKAGQLLRQMEKNKGGRPAKTGGDELPVSTLSDAKISKAQSSRWQQLADIPQTDFDQAIAEADRPSTNGIIRATATPTVTPVSKDALRLWGRLQDFAREGWLDRDPIEVMQTMTPTMLDEVHTLAPRVATWLRRIGAIDAKD